MESLKFASNNTQAPKIPEQNPKPTKESDGKAFQDTSPPPEEEVAPGVGQETYQSASEGHQKVCNGQIDYDIVQGLSELLELKSDKHDQEIFGQRQRSDNEHDYGEDGEVPRRDVPNGSGERVIGGGDLRCHGV